MKNELADLVFLSIREARSIEELAERLVDRGVQIVPEGAMILTRAELDALNKYQERFKGQDAREIFEELETSLSITAFKGSEAYYAIRSEDYNQYKKKYMEKVK